MCVIFCHAFNRPVETETQGRWRDREGVTTKGVSHNKGAACVVSQHDGALKYSAGQNPGSAEATDHDVSRRARRW